MGMDSIPMRTFLNSIAKWMSAMENNQPNDARFFVSQLQVATELLAFDPEFKQIFRKARTECDHEDPEQTAKCLIDFFHAVTDAGEPGRFRSRN
jgi:hypothetical protein